MYSNHQYFAAHSFWFDLRAILFICNQLGFFFDFIVKMNWFFVHIWMKHWTKDGVEQKILTIFGFYLLVISKYMWMIFIFLFLWWFRFALARKTFQQIFFLSFISFSFLSLVVFLSLPLYLFIIVIYH